ncbi:DNA-binding response regulator [Clostridia bacterium]|nr:DNA-binding response regulator [Clostridia bacterium]
MKVFLVDDEPYVIELLKNLIDWKALELEIVGVANDGIVALREIEKLRPDIVITDIKMPGIDGLELIRLAMKNDDAISFIVISGHKQFQFAQSALRFGVTDYLLKPLKSSELINILERVIQEKKERENQIADIQSLHDALTGIKGGINTMFLDMIVSSAFDWSTGQMVKEPLQKNIDDVNTQYYLQLTDGFFLFLICKIDQIDENSEISTIVHEYIRNDVFELFGDYCSVLLFTYENDKLIIFLNYPNENCHAIEDAYGKIEERGKNLFDKFENISISLCVGHAVDDVSDIRACYQSAYVAMIDRILFPSGNFNIVFSRASTMEQQASELVKEQFTLDFKNDFRAAAVQFSAVDIMNLIEQAFAGGIIESGEQNTRFCWKFSIEIFHFFLTLLDESSDEKRAMTALIQKMENASSILQIKQVLTQEIEEEMKISLEETKKTENVAVSIAKNYIQLHYQEKISLKSISEMVYLNPVYFSVLFKRQCGINFVDHVSLCRINVAKGLLEDIKYSLSEISRLTGFANVKYFSKIFKKYTGLTPSEYRNKIIS